MLNVDRAILHVFDFDSGSTYFSERPLDLDVRSTKSFVQRHLRKISSNAESRHGSFAPDSGFAVELQRYLAGEREFVEFSVEIAQWFWEELRRAEDLEQCDLLVADFTDTDAASGEDVEFEGDAGKRFFAIELLPRRQAFVHEVEGDANGISRVDATLPNPSQKVASYVLVDAATGAIDFHDKERSVGGTSVMVIPERFLQCSSEASSHEVIDEVSVIRGGTHGLRRAPGRGGALRGARARGIAARGGPCAARCGQPPDQEPQDPHGHRGGDHLPVRAGGAPGLSGLLDRRRGADHHHGGQRGADREPLARCTSAWFRLPTRRRP